MSDFTWDESALIPDTLEATLPTGSKDGEASTERVTLRELPRRHLIAFVSEAMDNRFVHDVEREVDGKLVKVTERLPFTEVSDTQSKVICKYLSLATDGAKKPEFFAKVLDNLTGKAIGALIDAFIKMNRLEEIAATGGNWLLLPQVRDIMATAAKEESGSQTQITPAS